MSVDCETWSVSKEDGAIQFAFDLAGSDARYLIISLPESEGMDDFFGHDHYIEVKDQAFGRYGGLSRFAITSGNRLEVGLAYEVPGVGPSLAIILADPITEPFRSDLARLIRG